MAPPLKPDRFRTDCCHGHFSRSSRSKTFTDDVERCGMMLEMESSDKSMCCIMVISKYLGLTLDVEHMTLKEGVSVLAQSAGSALGSVLNRLKANGF